MKPILAIAVIFLFSGLCHAGCTGQDEAANSFINAYKKYCDKALSNKTKETTTQWIQRNKKVTEHFKSAYQELV